MVMATVTKTKLARIGIMAVGDWKKGGGYESFREILSCDGDQIGWTIQNGNETITIFPRLAAIFDPGLKANFLATAFRFSKISERH
jgi:hypothetical protein